MRNRPELNSADLASAVNEAAVLIMSREDDNIENTLSDGISIIAEAAGCDRVTFWRYFDENGKHKSSVIYHWDKRQGGTRPLTGRYKSFDSEQLLSGLLSVLTSGGTLNGPASEIFAGLPLDAEKLGLKTVAVIPIFINDFYWGVVLWEDRTTERKFGEETIAALISSSYICANAKIRHDSSRSLINREKMMLSLNAASLIFLSQETSGDAMAEGINVLSGAAGFDRMGVYRDMGDGEYFSQVYLWDKSSGGTTEIPPGFDYVSYKKRFPSWRARLYRNEDVHATFSELCGPEAEFAKLYGIKAILVVPIFMEGGLWGCASFQDLAEEKVFGDETKGMLRSAALMCANAVIRREMTERDSEQKRLLAFRLEQQAFAAEIAQGLTGSGESNGLILAALEKIGKYLKTSRVLMVELKGGFTAVAYAWREDSLSYGGEILIDRAETVIDEFPETIAPGTPLPISVCDDISKHGNKGIRRLSEIGVKSALWAPLYVEERLWGMMCVEQCGKARHWSHRTTNFVPVMASCLSGVILRGIYDKGRAAALEQAIEASLAKSSFLSNMSHEMRTPLNAVTGMAAIGKNAQSIERKDYAFDEIQRASNHLLGVVNDVLDMSKIEANKMELSPVDFSFEKMIQKVIGIINYRAGEKGQSLKVTIDEKIPKFLYGDDQRLSQVITNLLSNAVKFTPERGEISLSAYDGGKNEEGGCIIRVTVSDSGIGISPEQQTRLFAAFSQAESGTSRKYGGTGLGLAISKRVVELMGGEISVKSEIGKGSAFTFTVNLKQGNPDEAEPAPEGEVLSDEGAFAGKTILLAEDVEINRDILCSLLEDTAVTIICAEDGERAVKTFEENKDEIDLVFMDIQMPNMDGFEATRKIRALPDPKAKSVPIVAMTANVFKDDIENCLAAGMNDHIGKPIDMEEVMKKLRKYIK